MDRRTAVRSLFSVIDSHAECWGLNSLKATEQLKAISRLVSKINTFRRDG
jgi:hypothetical protein